MEKQGEYIQSIEIKSLWKGGRHIVWHLRPDVNILSGINGVGKSTIINRSANGLNNLYHNETLMPEDLGDGISMKLYPEDANYMKFDVIRSIDRPLMHSDLMEKMSDSRVKTELDWQIYRLQKKYLDYQVNMGNRMIELLTSGDPSDQAKAQEVMKPKIEFQDLVDDLFSETGKRINRKSNEIQFIQREEYLTPYQLSSGEKQMLVILLTVLVEDQQPYVLFMDEPEVSLHVDWQERLIDIILQMNPNVQIILTTHSPAVIMNGWMDRVTEVSDITT